MKEYILFFHCELCSIAFPLADCFCFDIKPLEHGYLLYRVRQSVFLLDFTLLETFRGGEGGGCTIAPPPMIVHRQHRQKVTKILIGTHKDLECKEETREMTNKMLLLEVQ